MFDIEGILKNFSSFDVHENLKNKDCIILITYKNKYYLINLSELKNFKKGKLIYCKLENADKHFNHFTKFYDGYIKNGLFEDYGVLYYFNYYKDLEVYRGGFKNGLFNGYGVLRYSNGSLAYDGYLKNGKLHGRGMLYDTLSNIVFNGIFDKNIGKLVLYENGPWKLVVKFNLLTILKIGYKNNDKNESFSIYYNRPLKYVYIKNGNYIYGDYYTRECNGLIYTGYFANNMPTGYGVRYSVYDMEVMNIGYIFNGLDMVGENTIYDSNKKKIISGKFFTNYIIIKISDFDTTEFTGDYEIYKYNSLIGVLTFKNGELINIKEFKYNFNFTKGVKFTLKTLEEKLNNEI